MKREKIGIAAPTQHEASKAKRTVDRSIEGKLARMEAMKATAIQAELKRLLATEMRIHADQIVAANCKGALAKLGYQEAVPEGKPIEYPEVIHEAN